MIRRRARRLRLFILFNLVVFQSEAQEVRLSLQAAIEQALATNPELGMTQAQTDVSRGQVKQAGLKPNPRINVQSEDIRPGTTQAPFSFVNSTEDYLTLSQIFEVGGKRRGRIEAANSSLAISEDQQQVTHRQIVTRVSAAYWNAVLARRGQELTSRSLQTYDEDVAYLKNRVAEGVAAESDLIRIQIERSRVQAAALQAARDSNQAVVTLFRTIGRGEFPQATLTTALDAPGPQDIVPLEQALARRPELAIAKANVDYAETNVKLQHAYAKPDPQVFAGYKRNSGFDTAYAALQIDLPIRNRNQGNISSAQAQVHQAQANYQLTLATLRADYESAVRAYQDQQALVATLPGIVAQSQEAERRARSAYREGGLELLRLLDAERSYIQSEFDYARALTDLQQATVTLQLATGAAITGDSNR